MSPDLTEQELERQLTTMLRERAATVSERVPVDRRVVRRARRRRTMKLASVGSGVALVAAVVVAVVVSTTGSPSSSSKNAPASQGAAVRIAPPTFAVRRPPPTKSGWAKLPAAPISARAASAAAVADGAFVVWGGEGAHGERLMDGAWYDIQTGAWNSMSPSPLPPPSYPANHHFVAAQTVSDSVVVVSDGAVATYTPRTDLWVRLPDVPLVSLDNLALTAEDSSNVFLLTGVDRAGHTAYAALDFNPLGRTPVWTTGTLTGRSIGRPVIAGDTARVIVQSPEGPVLDVVRGIHPDAALVTQQLPPLLPTGFVPKAWNGREMLGGTGDSRSQSTLVSFDPTTSSVRENVDAYQSCGGVHIWTGHAVVSLSGTQCPPRGFEIAFNPTTGATNGVALTVMQPRNTPDFAVSPDGRLFVWGGVDGEGDKLADGAVLTLK